MAKDTHVYGEVNSKTGLKKIFVEIRKDIAEAGSRSDLTELYRRAGYLITLTHSSAWEDKFGKSVKEYRTIGDEEFRKTARKVNSRAKKLGTKADYDEKWGKG